jgi:hypothetical protein
MFWSHLHDEDCPFAKAGVVPPEKSWVYAYAATENIAAYIKCLRCGTSETLDVGTPPANIGHFVDQHRYCSPRTPEQETE